MTQLTRRIIDRFAPDALSGNDEKLERTESLSWWVTSTGMTRLVAELAPASAAILKEAITANSAPQPAKASEEKQGAAAFGPATDAAHGDDAPAGTGEPVWDERSPGKRRLDALMDLVAAGARAAAGDGVQAGAATVLLTMGLQELLAGHGATTPTVT